MPINFETNSWVFTGTTPEWNTSGGSFLCPVETKSLIFMGWSRHFPIKKAALCFLGQDCCHPPLALAGALVAPSCVGSAGCDKEQLLHPSGGFPADHPGKLTYPGVTQSSHPEQGKWCNSNAGKERHPSVMGTQCHTSCALWSHGHRVCMVCRQGWFSPCFTAF